MQEIQEIYFIYHMINAKNSRISCIYHISCIFSMINAINFSHFLLLSHLSWFFAFLDFCEKYSPYAKHALIFAIQEITFIPINCSARKEQEMWEFKKFEKCSNYRTCLLDKRNNQVLYTLSLGDRSSCSSYYYLNRFIGVRSYTKR